MKGLAGAYCCVPVILVGSLMVISGRVLAARVSHAGKALSV